MNDDDLKGFAIEPKRDCPHLKPSEVQALVEFLTKINTKHFSEFACAQCDDKSENWICLECQSLQCSRYVNSHMVAHNASTQHPIALSFSDSSFWCYKCESYIDHPSLIRARKQFSKSKFAAPVSQSPAKEEEEKLAADLEKLEIKEDDLQCKYEDIIDGLKNKKFEKIVILTGAGLSVASGIPDFRSPKTGLYSKLAEYNLPRPESVFQLDFYVKNPVPFMKLAKEFLSGDYQPTDGHKFIKKLNDEGMLHYNLTQNIDDLQIKAGLPEEKLIQAHGHSRSAHCLQFGCKKQIPIQSWVTALEKDEVFKCECGGLAKPDIVFFGESLPTSYYKSPKIMEEADLVFIIGTSLAVMPFAFLPHLIPQKVPIVLINNTDSLPQCKNKLWLEGDIQENIKKMAKDLDWVWE